MKQITLTLILSIFSFSYSQVELKLYSLDECNGEVKKLNFELADSNFNLYPDFDDGKKYLEFYSNPISIPKGTYHVFYNYEIENTDYAIKNAFEINLTDLKIYTDTIVMPKIRLGWTMALHSNERYYFKCDKKCNDKEVSYFKNGNKKLEGIFDNGKPLKITSYNKNATMKTLELFQNDSFKPFKIIRYDSDKILEYEVRTFRRKKTIIKTYDKNNKLIKREKLDYVLN